MNNHRGRGRAGFAPFVRDKYKNANGEWKRRGRSVEGRGGARDRKPTRHQRRPTRELRLEHDSSTLREGRRTGAPFDEIHRATV